MNLLAGEQRSEAYLAVNPQGKVPAIQVRGTIRSSYSHAFFPLPTSSRTFFLAEGVIVCRVPWKDPSVNFTTHAQDVFLLHDFVRVFVCIISRSQGVA